MTTLPEDFLVKAWKQQLDGLLRAAETLTEAAEKIRQIQLDAAVEAHAAATATQQSVAGAGNLIDLWKLQGAWLTANLEKSLAYWQSLYRAVAEADMSLARCVCERVPAGTPATPAEFGFDGSNQAMLGVMDSAYKQWLEATRQFYMAAATMGRHEPEQAARQEA